jgi:macrophage erythroblast attacher
MEERFKHLAAIETFGSDADPAVLAWCDTRLDRWLVDWSLRHGKEKTASSIVRAKNIQVKIPDMILTMLILTKFPDVG